MDVQVGLDDGSLAGDNVGGQIGPWCLVAIILSLLTVSDKIFIHDFKPAR